MENNKLFVTNLNFNTPLQKLVELCSGFGPVKDSYRPEGKGFAFITMQSAEDAKRIIAELSGTMLDGRPLRFELSVPKDSRPPRPENSGGTRPNTRPGATSSDRPRFNTPPSLPPPSSGGAFPGKKDDRKKTSPKKEEDFNKGPAKNPKAKQEKIKGGANRNRWIDDLDEDDADFVPPSLDDDSDDAV
jgi:RNA recognition motif-containing protein